MPELPEIAARARQTKAGLVELSLGQWVTNCYLLTHAHPDRILALAQVRQARLHPRGQATGAPLALHPADCPCLITFCMGYSSL